MCEVKATCDAAIRVIVNVGGVLIEREARKTETGRGEAGRLAGWLAGWLAGRQAGWLAGWLAGRLAGRGGLLLEFTTPLLFQMLFAVGRWFPPGAPVSSTKIDFIIIISPP